MANRNKKHIVRLDQEERESLKRLVRGGKAAARKISRARILLKAEARIKLKRLYPHFEA